jgi:hypothetical protein
MNRSTKNGFFNVKLSFYVGKSGDRMQWMNGLTLTTTHTPATAQQPGVSLKPYTITVDVGLTFLSLYPVNPLRACP